MGEKLDLLDTLVADVNRLVRDLCAKAAEVHFISTPENEYQRGYDAAAHDIAARIRRL